MKKIAIIISVLLTFAKANAQSDIRVQANQFHAWYTTNGITKINEKWGFFHDFQFRRASFISETQQHLFRGEWSIMPLIKCSCLADTPLCVRFRMEIFL